MSELKDTPKHLDLIYDIGMHKGEDTEFYLRKGFRVVAFEADPDLARLCRERLKRFIDHGRLTVVEGAIVDLASIRGASPQVRFFRNNDLSAWGTARVDWADRNERRGTSNSLLEVDVVDFVGVMQQQGVPHYMKIDIEGLDMVCVKALALFRERPDCISVESDKTSFANIKREIETLISLGYDSFQAVEQSAIPGISPRRIPQERVSTSRNASRGDRQASSARNLAANGNQRMKFSGSIASFVSDTTWLVTTVS